MAAESDDIVDTYKQFSVPNNIIARIKDAKTKLDTKKQEDIEAKIENANQEKNNPNASGTPDNRCIDENDPDNRCISKATQNDPSIGLGP